MSKTIEDLQKDKITLEIKKLKRYWFFEPQYITLILGLASLGLAYYKGFFDLERKSLEIKKSELKKEVNEFEDIKDSLAFEINTYKGEINTYKGLISNTDSMNSIAIKTLSKIITNDNNKIENQKEIENQIESLIKLKEKKEILKSRIKK